MDNGQVAMKVNRTTEESSCWECRYVTWSVALFLAVAAYSACGALIHHFFNPDVSSIMEMVVDLSILPPRAFNPELEEKALFLSGLVLLPAFLVLFHLLVRKKLQALTEKSPGIFTAMVLLSVFVIAAFAWLAFTLENPFHADPTNDFDEITRTNFDFYLLGTFLHNHFLAYSLLLFPLFMITLLRWETFSGRLTAPIRGAISFVPPFFYLLLIGLMVIINTFRFPYSIQNKWDFNAVYYSVVQVFYGTPLLVDNFTNTYGLYPQFVVPLLKLTGLSVTTFSALMSVLIALCFLLLLLFLRDNLENRTITLCCFCALVFYTHFFHKVVTPYDSTFANQPIRFLFPCIGLYLGSVIFGRSTSIRAVPALLVMACGVLWNPEFGGVTYIAFVLFLLYSDVDLKDRKTMFRKMALHGGSAVAALAVVFGFYAVVVRVLYGEFPALLGMFRIMKVFSLLGYYMLPMPLLHPWNLVALLYLIGIGRSIVILFERKAEKRDAMIFLVTLLGVATLSYYQGRSHNWNLPVTFPYALLLLALFAEPLLSLARRSWVHALPCGLLLFPLAASLPQLIYNGKEIAALVNDERNKTENLDDQHWIEENARFVAKYAGAGEKVLILGPIPFEALHYGLSETRAAINPGLMDLFWREDYERLIKFLALNQTTKIFTSMDGVPQRDGRLHGVISTFYNPKDSNGALTFMEKKKEI